MYLVSIVTLCLFNIAMENITICLKGKPSCSPSISMGHQKTMAMLVITRGDSVTAALPLPP